MTLIQSSIFFATLAGAMIPLGALIARVEDIHSNWLAQELRHSVMAFGGGVLLAAISFVLVPQAVSYLTPVLSVVIFAAGGLAFLWFDRLLARHGGSSAQLVAMVSDFVPEAMALGAMFASGNAAGPLLAVLIGLQNLPEGFNAYRELTDKGRFSPSTVLWSFLALTLLGPLAAVLGHLYLADQPSLVGAVMLFSAGGILYLVFQDIAPQAHLERRWAPPLGAVGGYTLGLLGHMLVS
jgi:ZIP family zinc transporter